MREKEAERKRRIAKVKIIFWTAVLLVICLLWVWATTPKVTGYTTHCVAYGETLWSIANKYNPDTDVERTLYEIRKVNEMKNSDIYAGDVLEIPIFE